VPQLLSAFRRQHPDVELVLHHAQTPAQLPALRQGRVMLVFERLQAPVVPHMGWSPVQVGSGSRLFAGVEQERFYFVHSYAAQAFPLDPQGPFTRVRPIVTWAEHGCRFVAAVENGPVSATQFHPEKSGDAGARLLANWVASL
jgi:glutamine amidotransferase